MIKPDKLRLECPDLTGDRSNHVSRFFSSLGECMIKIRLKRSDARSGVHRNVRRLTPCPCYEDDRLSYGKKEERQKNKQRDNGNDRIDFRRRTGCE
jgi:hypothetical protein